MLRGDRLRWLCVEPEVWKLCLPQGIDISGAKIEGPLNLSFAFQATGRVNLLSATIGGNLICDGGTFTNEHGDALFAQSIHVTGSVLLCRKFEANGYVSFYGARIGNTLHIAEVKEPEGMKLDAEVEEPKGMQLNLGFAKVQTLEQAENGFPAKDNLYLNGLVYEALGEGSLQKWDEQEKWLKLQPEEKSFSSQPYEQLAKVLQSTGHRDEAIRVLIAKEDGQLKYGKLGWSGLWKCFLGKTIAYGYRPQKALLWALLIVGIGSILFSAGYQNGLIVPTEWRCKPSSNPAEPQTCPDGSNYPKFDPVIYSLDVFLPIIDLRLKNSWQPNANKPDDKKGSTEGSIFHIKIGAWLRYYFWFHIISGWVLTTLWVAGFTGLVRNMNK